MDPSLQRRLRGSLRAALDTMLRTERWVESALGPGPGTRLARRRLALARAMKRESGRLEGLAYRVAARQPDPDVDDRLLRDRVASSLGPVVRRLDLPRVHVRVRDGVVDLEGRVDGAGSARIIEHAARAVGGVKDVRTSLLRELETDELRPSRSVRTRRSRAFRDLVGSVRALDVGDEPEPERLTGSVLAVFLATLPEQERRHVESHLPADVRGLTGHAFVAGTPARPRTVEEFILAVADAASRTRGTAAMASRTVLAGLRDLVPEETSDVAAVLPAELAELWADPLTLRLPTVEGVVQTS